MIRKKNKEFLNEVYGLIGDEYSVLKEYSGSEKKILMKHNICGSEYEVIPNSFLRGRRCPKCAIKIAGKSKLKSTKDFKNQIYLSVGSEYEVIGEYTGALKKITIKHNKCGQVSDVRANDFLNGSRCPKCFEKVKKTTNEFKEEVFTIVGEEYVVLSEYIHTHEKIKIKHNLCGHIYYGTPRKFLSGRRCPKCFGTPKKTTEEFIKEVYEVVGDEYTVVGEYVQNKVKILMKHNVCEKEYEVTPNCFLSHDNRCPNCSKSKGENKILEYCEKNNINYNTGVKFEGCIHKRKLPFDFGIYDNKNNLKMVIEYQGEQHYRSIKHFDKHDSFELRQLRDKIKREYCKNNNIDLLEIPYTEYSSLENVLNNILTPYHSTKIS